MILGAALATGTLLAVGTLLGHMILALANLASTRTTGLGALLLAVANTMTLLTTESTRDGGLLDRNDVLITAVLDVAKFTTRTY